MENEKRFQNFTCGEKKDKFTDEEASKELERIRAMLTEEAEHIELPESLAAENMMHLLEGVTPGEKREARVINLKREYFKLIAYAACFVLIIAGGIRLITGMSDITTASVSDENVGTEATAEETAPRAAGDNNGNTAESYDEIFSMFQAAQQRDFVVDEEMGITMGTGDSMPAAFANDAITNSTTSESVTTDSISTDSYTTTNTQYSDVDEGDIIKTDGEYLYHLRYDGSDGHAELVIVDADSMKVLSETPLSSYYNAEMYLSGDTLAVLYSDDWEGSLPDGKVSDYVSGETDDSEVIVPDWYSEDTVQATILHVYDVSNPEKPTETATYCQSGYYVSSRLADNIIYMVSDAHVNLWGISFDSTAASVFPAVGNGTESEILSTDCIYMPDSIAESASYCVVTAYNLKTGDKTTKAVLGDTDIMMMTGDTLILTSDVYQDWSDRSTGVTRFAVGGEDALTYISSGKVDGWVDGQFSLDVSDGILRIATTSYNENRDTVNGVYIYDEDMNLVGSVTGLAEGERIYSVRYIEDTAYIVTFRETDPLFAVDLSDPENPEVLGQLKIPGFSEYLHPAGDGLLIGLGNYTVTTSYGSVITDGIKLALFDISDPADPKEIDSVVLGNNGSSSAALDNHKAFMWDGTNSRFGFPATLVRTYGATADNPWGTSSSTIFDGYLVYTFDKNGFTRLGAVESRDSSDPFARYDYDDTVLRGVVIGDTLYTIADGGIDAWSYETFEKTGELKY